MTATTAYGRGLLDGLRPPTKLTPSQWADRYRMLSTKASAEPGHYRTDRTPYARAIADALSPDDPAEVVVWMKGAQIGATEIGNNWIGYIIHHNPGPTLMVMPTLGTAEKNSKIRIAPMIAETPVLRERVADPRSRDSSNTLFHKEFNGGALIITGANSAVGLRSLPIRNLFLDEVDGYPTDVDGEGDPVELAMKRTSTFGARRKVFIPSTPTIAGASRIETAFLQSDQRYYYVPCPHCGIYQVMRFPNLIWPPGRPREAKLQCEECEQLIAESKKTWMLERGEWRATAEGDGGRTVGFHLSALYSPLGWTTWGEICEQFVRAKEGGRDAYQEFVNLQLGEVFQEESTSISHDHFADRLEHYAEECPDGVLLLTVGADVQANRIEMEVIGWGHGWESWSIEKRILHGDPFQEDVWRQLREAIQKTYKHERGPRLRIARTFVDAGFASTQVHRFAASNRALGVYAVIGRATEGKPILSEQDVAARKKAGPNRVHYIVNVHDAKRTLYARLQIPAPGPGYCHFPARPEYDDEHFSQLVGERLVPRKRGKGAMHYVWEKQYPRVEALDIRVYGHAAALHFNPTWEVLDSRIDSAAGVREEPPPPSSTNPAHLKQLRRQARRQRDRGY